METVDWGYVVTTLVIRYAAIFIVLSLLIVLLSINGVIVSKLTDRNKKVKIKKANNVSNKNDMKPRQADPKIPVAIGLAIGLYHASEGNGSGLDEDGEGHAEWKMAGRVAQWRQKPGRG
jgi:Na+-transporting methylmalonyl-CoA/oxaloacetate decarboxylase gamma subunit